MGAVAACSGEHIDQQGLCQSAFALVGPRREPGDVAAPAVDLQERHRDDLIGGVDHDPEVPRLETGPEDRARCPLLEGVLFTH